MLSAGMTCSSTTSSQVLIMLSIVVSMDMHFNSAGLYSTHGLHTVSKRMAAFDFLEFFFPHVAIMGQIEVFSSAVP